MSEINLNIHQIYYNEESKKNCFDWTTHFSNEKCTVLFENQVISQLVEENKHLNCDYFGVWSHAFKHKVLGNKEFGLFSKETLEKFIQTYPNSDVIGFFSKFKNTNIWGQAESYHSGFNTAFRLMLKYGLDYDFNLKNHSIYILFNHWMARPEIYERYVNEMLNPCIDALQNKAYGDLQALIWNPKQRYSAERMRFKQNPKLKEQLGVDYYPLHPFLLERLPSLFFTLHKDEYKLNSW